MTSSATAPKTHRSWLHSPGLWCVVVGVALRVAWFFAVADAPFFYAHVQDAALYHELAQRILNEGLPLSGPFSVAPLYGFFLAAIYTVAGVDPSAVYLAQIALSAATIALTAGLGRRLFGSIGAWTGGLIAALYPVAIIYDVRLLSVGLGTFLTVGAAAAAHHAWVSGRARAWLVAGLVLGLGVLVRGNLLLVVPLVVMVAFWRGRTRHAFGCALGIGLAIAPVTLHNHAASGEVIPVALGGGINLYRGNNPFVSDAAVHPFRLPPKRDGLIRQAQLIASIETDHSLSLAESDRYWTLRALMHIADKPGRAVGLTFRKLTQVLSPVEVGDHLDLGDTVRASPVLKWIPPVFTPMVMLAVIGLGVTRRPRDAAPAVILVGSLFSVALFFVVSRYRAPLVPLLAIYAGGGLQWLLNALRARRRGPLLAGLVCMGATAASVLSPTLHPALPWNMLAGEARVGAPCAIDQHVRHAPDVEEQFSVGVFALNHGRLADAEAAMWAVLRTDESHTPAGVNLSWLLLQKGANEQAAAVATKVIAVDPCDDKAFANLATAKMRMGKIAEAHIAAKRAADIDPYNPGYWSTVGETMLAMGNRDGARVQFGRAVKWRPGLWQAHARLGQMALEDGKYAAASTSLQRAVKAQPGRVELIGMLGLSEVGRGNRAGAQKLLSAAVGSGLRGPALTALAKALSVPGSD
jgi:Flp pilus assembly protein TadD